MILKCEYCGKEYETYKKEQLFCSKSCASKYRHNNYKKNWNWKNPKVVREKISKTKREQIGRHKILKCEYCGKEFYRSFSHIGKNKHNFCSIKCFAKGVSGKNSYRWKGGYSANYGLSQKRWIKLKEKIMIRDNYKCCICNKKYKRQNFSREGLSVHHINPYLISKDNSYENLITLCRSCHLKIHRKMLYTEKGCKGVVDK